MTLAHIEAQPDGILVIDHHMKELGYRSHSRHRYHNRATRSYYRHWSKKYYVEGSEHSLIIEDTHRGRPTKKYENYGSGREETPKNEGRHCLRNFENE
jgi:hypothetical protein